MQGTFSTLQQAFLGSANTHKAPLLLPPVGWLTVEKMPLLEKPKLLFRSDFSLVSHMSLKQVGGFRAYLFLFDFIN